jgi:hypothetical protein
MMSLSGISIRQSAQELIFAPEIFLREMFIAVDIASGETCDRRWITAILFLFDFGTIIIIL